jgi:hypothetical protein
MALTAMESNQHVVQNTHDPGGLFQFGTTMASSPLIDLVVLFKLCLCPELHSFHEHPHRKTPTMVLTPPAARAGLDLTRAIFTDVVPLHHLVG